MPVQADERPLLQHKYRDLIRQHLGEPLEQLFSELAGVHFHIAWAPAWPKRLEEQVPPSGCSVCCQLSGSPLLPGCRICGPKQLVQAMGAGEEGHRFTCRLGVRNILFPLRVRGEFLGIAYLQALDRAPGRPAARRRLARAGGVQLGRAHAMVLNRIKFARAARLLQFLVQQAQAASLADLRKTDLTNAHRAVVALESEHRRLQNLVQRQLPTNLETLHLPEPNSRSEQLVHRLLEFIHEHYREPITLKACADKLNLNAAYASSLFSRVVGIPFKACLTELRIEKAKELLADPTETVSSVAYAVGYASENRFRVAFRKETGLCPRQWRETMQKIPMQ